MVDYIIRYLIGILEAVLFGIALYLFWKANKIIGGRLKKFVICVYISMLGFGIYGLSVVMLYDLNTVEKSLWLSILFVFGILTSFALMVSAYYLKNMFKKYKIE